MIQNSRLFQEGCIAVKLRSVECRVVIVMVFFQEIIQESHDFKQESPSAQQNCYLQKGYRYFFTQSQKTQPKFQNPTIYLITFNVDKFYFLFEKDLQQNSNGCQQQHKKCRNLNFGDQFFKLNGAFELLIVQFKIVQAIQIVTNYP
eukprot:TRINITY_DN38151_c0_g1_i3.p3 TRINITY_DN38151_c0_g1~~TRINITY_DN38151_c0_g1_i3.p3  ORF type:complete len:146 (-),score=5.42 TRINITY_DN38151_c0_g1_i3:301-738(-)